MGIKLNEDENPQNALFDRQCLVVTIIILLAVDSEHQV
jgi:hypothetical protein